MEKIKIIREVKSKTDKNVSKFLIKLKDGNCVESILFPCNDDICVCVSSQIGCPVGCGFCATGQSGFERSLNEIEIIGQAFLVQQRLSEENRMKVNMVCFAGMGEPLLNYEPVIGAIRSIKNSEGWKDTKFSITTVGIPMQIQRLSEENLPIRLYLSLNATTDEQRGNIIPIAKKYRIVELKAVMLYYSSKIEAWDKNAFNYLMLKGINDSKEDLDRLLKIADKRLEVNLRTYCDRDGEDFLVSDETLEMFQNKLAGEGITADIVKSVGTDIDAGCGQLRKKYLDSKKEE